MLLLQIFLDIVQMDGILVGLLAELTDLLTGGSYQRIDVGRLTDEADGAAAEVGRILPRGNRCADTIDLAHLLAQTLQQYRAQDGLQGHALHLVQLQVALLLVLLVCQRHHSLRLVARRADELNVAMGYLATAHLPCRIGHADGQCTDIRTDIGTDVGEVAVAHDDERVVRSRAEETLVQRNHVALVDQAVDDGVCQFAVGIVAAVHQPVQLTAEATLWRFLTREIALAQLVERHPADGRVNPRLRPP